MQRRRLYPTDRRGTGRRATAGHPTAAQAIVHGGRAGLPGVPARRRGRLHGPVPRPGRRPAPHPIFPRRRPLGRAQRRRDRGRPAGRAAHPLRPSRRGGLGRRLAAWRGLRHPGRRPALPPARRAPRRHLPRHRQRHGLHGLGLRHSVQPVAPGGRRPPRRCSTPWAGWSRLWARDSSGASGCRSAASRSRPSTTHSPARSSATSGTTPTATWCASPGAPATAPKSSWSHGRALLYTVIPIAPGVRKADIVDLGRLAADGSLANPVRSGRKQP